MLKLKVIPYYNSKITSNLIGMNDAASFDKNVSFVKAFTHPVLVQTDTQETPRMDRANWTHCCVCTSRGNADFQFNSLFMRTAIFGEQPCDDLGMVCHCLYSDNNSPQWLSPPPSAITGISRFPSLEVSFHNFLSLNSPYDKLIIKAALRVNFGLFFLSSKLIYMKNKQCKHVFGSLFYLERNTYCSTFTKNIDSSLIHSMNIFICLQAKKFNIYS